VGQQDCHLQIDAGPQLRQAWLRQEQADVVGRQDCLLRVVGGRQDCLLRVVRGQQDCLLLFVAGPQLSQASASSARLGPRSSSFAVAASG
jgi:hypothetical protein